MNKYKQDWKFEKFANFLKKEEHKERIYNLYLNSNPAQNKRLFLYLGFKSSNELITSVLDEEGLLMMSGIDSLIEKNKLFQAFYEFKCTNKECEHWDYETTLKSNKYMYKKCPKCNSKVNLINKNELVNTFYALYINYFEFYLLNEPDRTIYLIRNKYNGKTYTKSSDEALSNWLYIKLVENDCDIENYIFGIMGETKNIKTKLLKFLQDYSCIKTIDNFNFKPTKEKIFRVEDRKYFNIYTGNEHLNSIATNEEVDLLKDCINIHELLYNLTGKSKEGVNYLVDVLAMIVQEPHIKTKQLIIFYGEEAAGKGTFYDLILEPLFKGYITKILGKKIKSSFNGFMSKNLILVLEEVKSDKEEEDTLKELVTEDTILINQKNMPEREEQNYLTIFGFSNEQNPISAGKRRGVYFRSRTLGGSTDKAPIFRRRFEEEIPKEFIKFVDLLKVRKYDRVEIMKGLKTDAKQQVLDQNKSVIERFYDHLCCFESIKDYLLNRKEAGDIPSDYKLESYLHTYRDINYVDVNFLLNVYNLYLKKNKYNQIALNKFSEFWQLLHIDRDNKDHWRRLTPQNQKIQYVNLDKINQEIKLKFNEDGDEEDE